IVREHRHRGATDVANLLAEEATEILRTDAAIGLRHQSNVDVADIHIAGSATESRKCETGFFVCARDPSGFFSLDPRVREVRSGWSLDGDVDLRLILGAEEAGADESYCRQRERA